MSTIPPGESIFLQACSGQVPSITPVWLMRQAGRILRPYRELREKHHSIDQLFSNPELAAEITLMPVEMLGVDAAILFTDLVTPLQAMGCQFTYAPGPVFLNPVRTRQDVEALRQVDCLAELGFVLETIGMVRRRLPPAIPLIGFSGSPFTLASWMVEGRSARDFTHFRRMLFGDPPLAHLLLNKLTDLVIDFLGSQVRAGAQAIQLFDVVVGGLATAEFRSFALPYLQRLFAALAKTGVPRIYFPLAAPHIVPLAGNTGADVLSLDWRTDLHEAFVRFSPELALQGNLDPCALFGSGDQLVACTRTILDSAVGHPHIFNLGHGVLPETPVDQVRLLVDTVHELSTRRST